MVKELLRDIRFITLVIIAIISIALLPVLVGAFGLLFFLMMFLSIMFISPILNKFLLKFAINEVYTEIKMGSKVFALPDKYEKHFGAGEGIFKLLKEVILINFLAVLLVSKFMGVGEKAGEGALIGYLIAFLIATFTTLVITPISVSLYIVEGTKFRILDLKSITIDYPAYFYRRFFRSVFGFGNLIVVLWIFLDSLAANNWDIVSGLTTFILLILLVLGSLIIGAILSVFLIWKEKPDSVMMLMDEFNSQLEIKSLSAKDALDILKEALIEEKMELEELKLDETEQESVEGMEEKINNSNDQHPTHNDAKFL